MFRYENKYQPLNDFEFARELNARILLWSILAGVAWLLMTILAFLFTRSSTPVWYWIWRISRLVLGWGCILLFVLFVVREIITLVFYWRHRND